MSVILPSAALGQAGDPPDILRIFDQFVTSSAAASRCTKPDAETLARFMANFQMVSTHASQELARQYPARSSQEIEEIRAGLAESFRIGAHEGLRRCRRPGSRQTFLLPSEMATSELGKVWRTMSCRALLIFALFAHSSLVSAMGGEGIVGQIISSLFALYFWAIVLGIPAYLSIRKHRPSLATGTLAITGTASVLAAVCSASLLGVFGVLLPAFLFVPLSSLGLIVTWLYLQITRDRSKPGSPYASERLEPAPLRRLGEHDDG